MVLDHMAIVVNDIDEARDFFVDNFGFEAAPLQIFSGAWVDALNGMRDVVAQNVHLTLGGSAIDLLKFLNPASTHNRIKRPNDIGLRHFGFSVDDIEATVARIQAQGWTFLSQVQTVGKVKTVYFYGPEGILVQLTENIR
jgi:catechol 2,3-dioxygenase-like lactoylglutathione lyase family enzyme